jgi:type III secretory pathway component EscV
LLILNGKGYLRVRNLLKRQRNEELSMQNGREIFEDLRRWKRQKKEELLVQIEEGILSVAKGRGRVI